MRRPMPTTPDRKRELMAAIVREGGQPILDAVAEFRAAGFPDAKLVSIKVGSLDVGEPDPPPEKCEVFTHDHPAMSWLRFMAGRDAARVKKGK